MSVPILVSKLFIPPPGTSTVPRPRLADRLNEGLHGKLTLVSAPAGFGKTTVVSAWSASIRQPVAWLSLEAADSDPGRFLSYLVASIQAVLPTFDPGDLSALHTTPSSREAILLALLNELATLHDQLVLVLDDYHVVDSEPIDRLVTFLLEHLPAQVHLVITTREDPALPLARLRARRQLTEVRAGDLRFTTAEAATFLNDVMGLHLSPSDLEALEARTEGWIAGMHLAALSMTGHDDVSGFIRAFTGSHRFVMDYLVDDVLHQQPADVQEFLLRTSMLDRLHGPLCDAVLEVAPGSGQRTLAYLDRANLFLVPLDDERRWYRYHHLFADLLRQRWHQGRSQAGTDGQAELATAHRRASAWFQQHGSIADAIHHALAAEDYAHAADLIELAWPDTQRLRQEVMALEWLDAIPGHVFAQRPILSLAHVGTLLSNGKLVLGTMRLREIERWIDPDQSARIGAPTVADATMLEMLPGTIAIYRAGVALAHGDVVATKTHAEQALDLLPPGRHVWRGAAAALLGLSSWPLGDLDATYQAYADGMEDLRLAGNISDVVGGSVVLADIRLAQGRLRRAHQVYESALQLAVEHGEPTMRGTADMYVGLADLARERNDLPTAAQYLQLSQQLGEHLGFPQHPWRWRVVAARIEWARGNLDAAATLLDEAKRRYVADFHPNLRPVDATIARLQLAQGNARDALDWARDRALGVDDDLPYLREYEYITLARILLATGEVEPASSLLARLGQAAEAGGRMGSLIEIGIIQALVYQAMAQEPAAHEVMDRVLTLASTEGYARLFLDEGPALAPLLATAAGREAAPTYAGRLLGMISPPPTAPAPGSDEPLSGLLSVREIEVLALLAQGLSNREIGDRLYLALDTVKGHNRRIFAKLEVESRSAAIVRARELGLV